MRGSGTRKVPARVIPRSFVPLYRPFRRGKNGGSVIETRRSKRIMNTAEQFEALVADHYQPLFRFALSLTRTESDAWDLTQQTFCIWATKGDQMRDPSKAKTWLFSTLHRAFLSGRRHEHSVVRQPLEEVSEQLPVVGPVLPEQLDSSHALSALGRVDEVYQAAVALFYLEDRPYKEIAEILGVLAGTIKSRIARGIMQLRGILGRTEPMPAAAAVNVEAISKPGQTPKRGYSEWDLSPTFLQEDLTGTEIANVVVDLSASTGTGDGQVDTVVVNGTETNDIITVSGSMTNVEVAGLSATVTTVGAEPTLDKLIINALDGDDRVNASAVEAGAIPLILIGGRVTMS